MDELRAYRILIRGTVQGVGFRPFVHRLALRYDLCGWAANSVGGVEMEIFGSLSSIELFLAALRDPPPLAGVEEVVVSTFPLPEELPQGFTILPSRSASAIPSAPPPDAPPCPNCLSELFNPHDRRYHYPFINCTDCGPRYTVIGDIPYDRPFTTMAPFPMCPGCAAEYTDINSHRFHAQTDCCPLCGPHYRLADGNGSYLDDVGEDFAAISKAGELLSLGKIIAIKGVGGFHLVCDAFNERAVSELRRRKKRPGKPFAMMAPDLKSLRDWCALTEAEEKLFLSPERPIVLLRRCGDDFPAPSVAPFTHFLGVMLPHAPLHHLLFAAHGFRALVMTSGNLAGSPIIIDNEQAVHGLKGVADYFLLHDRQILMGNDDSVMRVNSTGRNVFLRRSRSFVPRSLSLTDDGPVTLGFGAMLKNTLCLAREKKAYLSQHLGDVDGPDSLARLRQTIEHLCRCLRADPELLVHDLHPEYQSTLLAQQFGEEKGLPVIGVQHHHAHALSCMAEHGLRDTVIAVVFDGTGYGPDGTIWGGEIMVVRPESYERVGYLEPVNLIGGEQAVREPWRLALAYLYEHFGGEIGELNLDILAHYREKIPILVKMVDGGLNAPLSSGCGRLFDGVAALLGLTWEASYEAEAAAKIEMLADPGERAVYEEVLAASEDGVFRSGALFGALVADIHAGVAPRRIAARFQNTLARYTAMVCLRIAHDKGLERVVLSGGVFQNIMFGDLVESLLGQKGFSLYAHRNSPPGDGGICLGQVVAGRAITAQS